MVEKTYLGVYNVRIVNLEHGVQTRKHAVQIAPKTVFKMAAGGFGKQKPALNNQFENILQTFKTLLNRFLFFKGGHVVGAMLNAG